VVDHTSPLLLIRFAKYALDPIPALRKQLNLSATRLADAQIELDALDIVTLMKVMGTDAEELRRLDLSDNHLYRVLFGKRQIHVCLTPLRYTTIH
jgi:hypothetical protein